MNLRRASEHHLLMERIESEKMDEIKTKILDYLERLKRAAVELEGIRSRYDDDIERIRLAGKIEGVTLAIRYFEEMFKV